MSEKKYDVGILGVWMGCNYGSIATYYALNKIISGMGYSVLMIDKPQTNVKEDVELSMTHSRRFAQEHYEISKSYKLQEFSELNSLCDKFVIGSDQVWNYGISRNFGKSFYFDFADSTKGKVAYAVSFGHGIDFAPEEERKRISRYMGEFDAISVREADGVKICKDIYHVNAEQVLDPVFLADRKIFDELAEKANFHEKEKYIATYILDPTPEKIEAMQYVSKKLGYKLVNMLDGLPWLFEENQKKLGMEAISNLQVEDWIACFKNSEFVITDSCHGASFALLYEKTVIPITNKRRGYSRFKSLSDLFGFSDRLVTNPQEIMEKSFLLQPMNYRVINEIMRNEKERCYAWLENALNSGTKKHKSILPQEAVTTKLDSNLCTGCGACTNVCPVNALKLADDEFGFYRSQITLDKCINCGKCANVCPALNSLDRDNEEKPKCYAVSLKNKDIVKESSSGGIFTALATKIFEKKGVVVGAAWGEDYAVNHIMIQNELELFNIRKSKYVQSYIGTILKEVKRELEKGKDVLFSGCPCQIAGLKSFLGKEYDNLLLVDILCSYVPSHMFFKKYLQEIFPEGISKYEFRHKTEKYKWDCFTVNITTNSGEDIVRRGGSEDNYQRAYHSHIMCPVHCEKCKYQKVPRVGDLTIGDFWGIEKKDTSIDRGYGISLVLCNNKKGEEYLKQIDKNEISIMKNVPLEWMGKNGYAINDSKNYCSPKRNEFFDSIKQKSFSESLNYALKPNHGEYNEIYNNTNTYLQYDTSMLHFQYDSQIWEEHFINGNTVLIVKPDKWKVGKYATLSLCKALRKGEKYTCTIRYRTKTESNVLNFHIKDSGSNYYQVIKTYRISEQYNENEWIELSFEFVPKADIYDEFMIGASQVSGANNYISFNYINIKESV